MNISRLGSSLHLIGSIDLVSHCKNRIAHSTLTTRNDPTRAANPECELAVWKYQLICNGVHCSTVNYLFSIICVERIEWKAECAIRPEQFKQNAGDWTHSVIPSACQSHIEIARLRLSMRIRTKHKYSFICALFLLSCCLSRTIKLQYFARWQKPFKENEN